MTVTFNNCCGCISLKRGSFIIGYMNLVAAVILIIVSLLGIIFGQNLLNSFEYKDRVDEQLAGIIIIIFTVAFIISIFHLFFTIILLVGLHQNKRKYVKVYLIFSTIFLAIYIIGSILSLFVFDFSFLITIRHLFSFAVSAYYLLVIRNYYLKMGEDLKPLQPVKGYYDA